MNLGENTRDYLSLVMRPYVGDTLGGMVILIKPVNNNTMVEGQVIGLYCLYWCYKKFEEQSKLHLRSPTYHFRETVSFHHT